MTTKKETAHSKFTGFHVSTEADLCVRMYAMTKNISITRVYRNMTIKWIEDNSINKERMIQTIAENMLLDWEKRFFVKPIADKEKFIQQWTSLLTRKIPSKQTVTRIIKLYHHLTLSNEKNEEGKA